MLSAIMMCTGALQYGVQYYGTACLILVLSYNFVQTHELQANLKSAEITLHKVSQKLSNNAKHWL